MSFRCMLWAWEVDGLTTTTKMVLLGLAQHANETGGSCFPSVARLASECRLSERAVQKAFKALEDEGYIRVDRRNQMTNNFTLLMNLQVAARRMNEVRPQEEVSPNEVRLGANEVRERANEVRAPGEPGSPEPVNEPIKYPVKEPVKNGEPLPGLAPPAETSAKKQRAVAEQMVHEWNAICGSKLPKVQQITDWRLKMMTARLKDLGGEMHHWRRFLNRVVRGPLLIGETGRGWRADFDWVLKPANFLKIIEGNYDDRSYGANIERRFQPSPGTV